MISGVYSSGILLFLYLLNTNSIKEIEIASNKGKIIQIIFIQIRPFLYAISIYFFILFDKKDDNAEKDSFIYQNKQQEHNNNLISGLSKRENEIIILVSNDLTNKEIGEQLFISPFTVKKHLYNIFTKLNISQRSEIKYLINKEQKK